MYCSQFKIHFLGYNNNFITTFQYNIVRKGHVHFKKACVYRSSLVIVSIVRKGKLLKYIQIIIIIIIIKIYWPCVSPRGQIRALNYDKYWPNIIGKIIV
jgi:hypothetical protein